MPRLTYDEMRSNTQKIRDEQIKERVLRGIEVLNEEYGPDWVDKVHLGVLDLSNGTYCVLGQIYDDVPLSDEHSLERPEYANGYEKGLAILDGVVEEDPSAFGFCTEEESWARLDAAWRIALGAV